MGVDEMVAANIPTIGTILISAVEQMGFSVFGHAECNGAVHLSI